MKKLALSILLLSPLATYAAKEESKLNHLLNKTFDLRIKSIIPEFKGNWSYITIDADAVQAIQTRFLSNVEILGEDDGIALARVPEGSEDALSAIMHRDFNRCGGFVLHEDKQDALLSMQMMYKNNRLSRQLVPEFEINNQVEASQFVNLVDEAKIRETINNLANFKNRYYTSKEGIEAAEFIYNTWSALAKGNDATSLKYFKHQNWPQNSVILRIEGSEYPDEVYILGGHLDSIAGFGGSHVLAPGADDDASGIATITEILRVLITSDFKPKRSIEFMAYAAEEVGLRGSSEIASHYAKNNINVKGVLQFDMTNYKGSESDIYIYEDFTNPAQNQFLKDLVANYLPDLNVATSKCGYGCSDHASWTRQGFIASMPSESKFKEMNPHIHTARDTILQSNNTALHAAKFAKLGAIYLAETTK